MVVVVVCSGEKTLKISYLSRTFTSILRKGSVQFTKNWTDAVVHFFLYSANVTDLFKVEFALRRRLISSSLLISSKYRKIYRSF